MSIDLVEHLNRSEISHSTQHALLPPAGDSWPITRANLINAWDVFTRPSTFDQRPEPEIPMLSFSPLSLWMYDRKVQSSNQSEYGARKHYLDLRQGTAPRFPYGGMVAERGTVVDLMISGGCEGVVNSQTAGFFVDGLARHAMLIHKGRCNIEGYLSMGHRNPSDMLLAYLGEELAAARSNRVPFTPGQGPHAISKDHGSKIYSLLGDGISPQDLAIAIGMRMIELKTPEGEGHDNDPQKGLQELYHRLYSLLTQSAPEQLALTLSGYKPQCFENIISIQEGFDLYTPVFTD